MVRIVPEEHDVEVMPQISPRGITVSFSIPEEAAERFRFEVCLEVKPQCGGHFSQ